MEASREEESHLFSVKHSRVLQVLNRHTELGAGHLILCVCSPGLGYCEVLSKVSPEH